MDSICFIHREILSALGEGKPVVALESAVITHGLPQPLNLQCARALEEVIRGEGALPATIGVLDGQIKIGLEKEEMEYLSKAKNPVKMGLHNLFMAPLQKITGGTTVAATIHLACKAGIEVMATGGIGGVHRGNSGDTSGDLPALSQTNIMVVCSGAKIILDLPMTREWLETWNIPVVGYGTSEFPGFYTASTGLKVDIEVHCVEEIQKLWEEKKKLGLSGAMLVVQPPPKDMALSRKEAESFLSQALEDCVRDQIQGSAVTPFLLQRLSHNSQGKTLPVNLALLRENARLAAKIAIAGKK